MKSKRFFRNLVIVAGTGLLMLAAFPSRATAQDDPSSRVARLNMAQGSVSFQPAGEQDWVAADYNRPLTTGDGLWADQDSRGELHIGSTSIRISSLTGLTFLNLNDRTVQIQLAQGTMEVTLREIDNGDAFEIDTPNVAFSVSQPGRYRVDVDPQGQTTAISVLSGQGQVTGGGNSYDLSSGQRGSFTGTDTPSYDITNISANDDFDNWCRSRDEQEDQSVSAQYVSPDVTGYGDLDNYGTWTEVPDYGEVWVPSAVPAGWAPYHFGHWVWIEPWGWTWIEDEPWGFAPFHYGRWAYVGVRWVWVPGPRVVHPVYAPALVVFVGTGVNIAWFPLGPREVYVPAYHCSPRYVQYVNVTNTRVTNIEVTNVYTHRVDVTRVTYINQNVRGSVTAVSHDTFVNARPVAREAVRVDSGQFRRSAVIPAPPVAPQRQSLVREDARPAPHPPARVASRPVVAKLPAPPPPVPFERREPELQQQPGRPLTPEKVQDLRKPGEEYQHPNVKYAPPRPAPKPQPHVQQPRPPKPKPAKPHGRPK
ncbi:MAG TPA: DUF6600 domain-containing protein [Candidatus Acidoferrales bacterium]|nr:DUF6600 domain-containing protein [Candidatus Acidoferrales bacterium]